MMKKLLLSLSALALLSSAGAQSRLSIYEEFSGENCGPCASANPGLWTLLSANSTKVLLVKYQSPIPSAGPIYNQNTVFTDNRMNYYSVPFAPYGRLNGTGLGSGTAASGSPGHVANLIQSDIDSAYAVTSPFNISATHAWNATGDSVTITVNVTATVAFAPANAIMKLRLGLIEHLQFDTPPGTNGETEFHNVMREMYPDANGTNIANSWTSGQTQTFVIKGKVPNYLDKTGDVRAVAFIQNDANRYIVQSAVSTAIPIPLDVRSDALIVPSSFLCAASSTSVSPTVTLKNTGTTPLTSAVVYYRVDNGAWQSYNWTGNIAANATGTANLPATTITPGSHIIYDSVAAPNGSNDINVANNVSFMLVSVHNTNGAALPISEGFENNGNLPANWTLLDVNSNFDNWIMVFSNTTNIGQNNSKYTIRHFNYNYPAGESNIAVMPVGTLPSGNKALDFWVAYAQYQAENDKLEVVYSTNCGQNWTSVWSAQGSGLATTAPTTSNYVPAQTDWKLKSVDVSSVPNGALIALRATSDYGNNLYVDNVNLRSGATVGIEDAIANSHVTLFPNPAKDFTTLGFTLKTATKLSIQVLDATGRVISTPVDGEQSAGAQNVKISTENLAVGIYNIKIQTEAGSRVERLTVVK